MLKGKNEYEMICGILHDIVEDTDYTFERLKEEGFSDAIIDTLRCVTRLKAESYEDFVIWISMNKPAVNVKINDLEDNMDITRLTEFTEADLVRQGKYERATYSCILLFNSLHSNEIVILYNVNKFPAVRFSSR